MKDSAKLAICIVLLSIISIIGYDIKGLVISDSCDEGDEEYSEIGEVYLYNSLYSLIDSTCIGEVDQYEYRFTGLSNGTYYVRVKVALSPGCHDELIAPPAWYKQSDSTQVIISGGNGDANLYAPVHDTTTTTSCR
ncbi:hypothetical protein KAH81_07075 [bacterium]|nr:hypothetical protein [bacterium]